MKMGMVQAVAGKMILAVGKAQQHAATLRSFTWYSKKGGLD
jgi:hypothetical protein